MLRNFVIRTGSSLLCYRRSISGSTCCMCVPTAPNQNLASAISTNRCYGQPTGASHPHLLRPGELTAGLCLEEYKSRRHRLIQAVRQYAQHITLQAKCLIIIVPSATKVYMTEKIPYPFRQNSDFSYLTGFLEPDSVLILKLDTQNAKLEHEEIIFVPKRDSYSELWDGPRTGADGAISLLGVDEAYNIDDLSTFLSSVFCNAQSLALWCDFQNIPQPFVERALKAVVADHAPKFLNSYRLLLQQLRVLKSPAEAALMAESCEIASKSFVEVIADTKPFVTEHQLYSKMDFACRTRGADRLAYPPVVAGGDRANIIHYVANNHVLFEDELILMDAGCEYGGYVSDITRTWPVKNTFSVPQKELYEALLETQQMLIALCKERISLDQLYKKMIDLLGIKLQELGVIDCSVSNAERSKITQRYCPHHVGHYLGMDVHDTPLIPRSRPLEPGMAFTIEPGIYISQNDQFAPRDFQGVGIRIEDNLLITESGLPLVLSAKCPKTVDDIESIRRNTSL